MTMIIIEYIGIVVAAVAVSCYIARFIVDAWERLDERRGKR
jgi:hypothetical protein